MIKSILADHVTEDNLFLENILRADFPDIHISGKSQSIIETALLINQFKPELIFINIELPLNKGLNLKHYYSDVNFEIIFTATTVNHAVEAFGCNACGYLIKPISADMLSNAVNNFNNKNYQKKQNSRNKMIAEKYLQYSSSEDVIGIPTIEGFEFISINDIIRCEGLQKCTQVITKERSDIISSYNLGEFRKMLEPYGFYSPHKSHLINLKYIRKYHREGNILMINNSFVPVAKRKKSEFLTRVKHL
ncbi:MAG: response regulator transcription factor [Bacteroidales bacterium]|nr:response regulator transcription factor [Bacteroidales bacterium]